MRKRKCWSSSLMKLWECIWGFLSRKSKGKHFTHSGPDTRKRNRTPDIPASRDIARSARIQMNDERSNSCEEPVAKRHIVRSDDYQSAIRIYEEKGAFLETPSLKKMQDWSPNSTQKQGGQLVQENDEKCFLQPLWQGGQAVVVFGEEAPTAGSVSEDEYTIPDSGETENQIAATGISVTEGKTVRQEEESPEEFSAEFLPEEEQERSPLEKMEEPIVDAETKIPVTEGKTVGQEEESPEESSAEFLPEEEQERPALEKMEEPIADAELKETPVLLDIEGFAGHEREIVSKLKRIFPDGVIYADQYLKKVKKLSFPIYKLAKAAGVGRERWLNDHGFIWKETGYIEADMEPRQVSPPKGPEDLTGLAAFVFESYPLAGQYRLSKDEEESVYQAASQIVRKILTKQRITLGDESVLVLATVQLLRNWSTDSVGEPEGKTFWNYIYLQFGFNPQKSGSASQRLYMRFRMAIAHTLQRFRRFLAPEGTTQRYYTSLLLHAMAPVQSMESLFNILFDFYGKNLNFHYVAEDVSYKTLIQGMQSRWAPNIREETFHLRSDLVTSGLKVLFQERPGYMASLCENLVKKMDALLRGADNELNPERDYWDYLLLSWYQKKSTMERAQIQSDRRANLNEYVAVSPGRISIRYGMEDGKVGMVIPKIRLMEVGQARPILNIYQEDNCIFEDELAVTGNELSMTTRARFIPLEETGYDFDKKPHLIVEVIWGEQLLYRSDKKLWREFVFLDEKGQERLPKAGWAFLFVGGATKVDFFAGEDILQEAHPGQLFRFPVENGIEVTVDGVELLQNKAAGTSFRYHTTQRPVNGFYAMHQGKRCPVFSAPFSLLLRLPTGEEAIRYRLAVNGQSQGMAALERQGDAYCIPAVGDPGKISSVCVIDLLQGTVKFQFDYMCLPGCTVKLDIPFYRAGVDQVSATVAWEGDECTAVSPLMQDADSVGLSLERLDVQFELEVPAIRCSLGNSNAFLLPNVLWHEELTDGEVVDLHTPEGWTGKVLLDGNPVPASSVDGRFELGNQLRAKNYDQAELMLSLALENSARQTVRYDITSIVLQPKFVEPPLVYQEDRLLWCAKDNFIGKSGTVFQVSCQMEQGVCLSYTVDTADQVLEESVKLENGTYPYQVSMRKRSLFSHDVGEQLLFEGVLCVGDVRELAFAHQEILVGDAICWDFEEDALKNVAMKIGCGVITKLQYLGMDVASGETVPAPHYQGTLCYVDRYGKYQPFNAIPSREYEQVNPVNVWIINEHLLILRCVTEDAVYIDTHYSSIVNRNPVLTMTKVEQRDRLMNPDYFEYRTRKA